MFSCSSLSAVGATFTVVLCVVNAGRFLNTAYTNNDAATNVFSFRFECARDDSRSRSVDGTCDVLTY